MANDDVKKEVRTRYGQIATKAGSCCSTTSETNSCCDPSAQDRVSKSIGYSDTEMAAVPEGANLGLGCGNPVAIASLKQGDMVLDLGSGAGFDCFLAADRVGESGRVIGVDMTPEMLDKARANAQKGGYTNVEFRAGEIEALPLDSGSVNVVISNCVINLSPDKPRVFAEIERVLAPGGRFFISDLVLLRPLPEAVRNSAALYSACISGAMPKDAYLATARAAGLEQVRVTHEATYPLEELAADPVVRGVSLDLPEVSADEIAQAARSVVSIHVEGRKPA